VIARRNVPPPWLAIYVAVLLSGCGYWQRQEIDLRPGGLPGGDAAQLAKTPRGAPPARADEIPPDTTSAGSTEPPAEKQPSISVAEVTRLLTGKTQVFAADGSVVTRELGTWQRQPNNNSAEGYRWSHPGLEALLARAWTTGEDPATELRAALDSPNPVVRATAAIGLARLQQSDGRVLPTLIAAADDFRTPVELSAAAIESLGRLDTPEAERLLHAAIKQVAESDNPRSQVLPGYRPRVHEQLLHSLALRDALTDAEISAALASSAETVRLTALRLWEESGRPPPEGLYRLLDAPGSPRMKSALIRTLAKARDESIIGRLQVMTQGRDLASKLVAIDALGKIGSDRARKILRDLYENQAERIREVAVVALVAAGDLSVLSEAADDPQWVVRRGAAVALRKAPSGQVIAEARKLALDSSTAVRLKAVESLADWPLKDAGPILLLAAEKSDPRTARRALEVLAGLWPPVKESLHTFTAALPAEDRTTTLERLKRRWSEQFAVPLGQHTTSVAAHVTPFEEDETPSPRPAPNLPPLPDIPPRQLAEVSKLLDRFSSGTPPLRKEAAARLRGLGPGLVPALDALARRRARPLPERLFTEVLVDVDPLLRDVEQLASDRRVGDRRRAAKALAGAADERPLPYVAVYRMSKLVFAEEDSLVWLQLLDAIGGHDSDAAQRIAYLATTYEHAPEVRRRGCAFLAAHPNREHEGMLLSLLVDADSGVRIAAATALGELPGIDRRWSDCFPTKTPTCNWPPRGRWPSWTRRAAMRR